MLTQTTPLGLLSLAISQQLLCQIPLIPKLNIDLQREREREMKGEGGVKVER